MGDMFLHGKLGVSMIGRSALYRCGAIFEGLWFFETYPGRFWGLARCLSAWCFVPWVVDGSPGKPCKVVRWMEFGVGCFFFLGGGKFHGLELSWFIGFNFFRFFFQAHLSFGNLASWVFVLIGRLGGFGGLVMSNSRRLVFYSYDKGWPGWQGALTEPKNLPIDWFWFGFLVKIFFLGRFNIWLYIYYIYI